MLKTLLLKLGSEGVVKERCQVKFLEGQNL